MNMRILIAAIVVSMFVCQQVYAQDNPEAEATELEGTWEVVSKEINGIQHDFGGFGQWRVEGNRLFYRWTIDGTWSRANPFSVDPSAMPAEIDYERYLGIYEIDGDLLRICSATGTRPDRFESTEVRRSAVEDFERRAAVPRFLDRLLPVAGELPQEMPRAPPEPLADVL